MPAALAVVSAVKHLQDYLGKIMVQLLPKVPGFGERMGEAIGGGLGGGFMQGMQKQQDFSNQLKLQEAKKKEDKVADRNQALQSLQGTITEIKAMAEGDVPGIGLLGSWDPRPEAQHNRGKMQTLGSDLLSFYKTLFPRGITQQEFIRLEKDYIPKPGEATSKMLGKLEGFANLIERKLKEEGGSSGMGEQKKRTRRICERQESYR